MRVFRIRYGFLACAAAALTAPPVALAGPIAEDLPARSAAEVPPSIEGWDARIEYSVDTVTVEAPRAFASGEEALLNRPMFATLQRRFEWRGRATPYVGLGAGYAAGLGTGLPDTDALAIKGVIGADVAVVHDLDVFVELGYARETGPGTLESGQISTGLRFRLN